MQTAAIKEGARFYIVTPVYATFEQVRAHARARHGREIVLYDKLFRDLLPQKRTIFIKPLSLTDEKFVLAEMPGDLPEEGLSVFRGHFL